MYKRQSFPKSLSIPGAIAVQVDGTVAIASVAATSDAEIDSICSQYNASVEIEDLNLEEVFLELHHVDA